MVLNGRSGSVWVASTCSTSDVPMPKAMAPKAPCVDVWLSPQTIVMPGWVRPSCGPMTCTMPCSVSPIGNSRTPNSAQLRRSVSTCVRDTGSAIGRSMPTVGHVVILGGDGEIRPAHRPAGLPQPVERLRAGYFVHQMQIDVEQIGLGARTRTHHVLVPHLLGKRVAHHFTSTNFRSGHGFFALWLPTSGLPR